MEPKRMKLNKLEKPVSPFPPKKIETKNPPGGPRTPGAKKKKKKKKK